MECRLGFTGDRREIYYVVYPTDYGFDIFRRTKKGEKCLISIGDYERGFLVAMRQPDDTVKLITLEPGMEDELPEYPNERMRKYCKMLKKRFETPYGRKMVVTSVINTRDHVDGIHITAEENDIEYKLVELSVVDTTNEARLVLTSTGFQIDTEI